MKKPNVTWTKVTGYTALLCVCLGFVFGVFQFAVRPALNQAISSAFSEMSKNSPVGDFSETGDFSAGKRPFDPKPD